MTLCLGVIILLVFALVALFPPNTLTQNTAIKCNDKDFEVVFSKIISFGEPDRKYPENVGEIPIFCSETKELIRRFEQHKEKCLKATMRNFVGILSYSIKVQIKRLCAKKRPARIYPLLEASPCINRNNAKLGKCLDAMSLAFAGIRRAPESTRMHYICCQYVEMQKCFRKVLEANKCEKHISTILEQMHLIMGNFIDNSCGEYNPETDRCEKLGPPPKAPKNSKANKFIKNLVDIFDSIQ